MAERLDRALDLLERLVVAVERIADRDVKPANDTRRPRVAPSDPDDDVEVTELDEARARAAARRLGLIVRE